jgi:hypothetical protein
MRKLFKQTKVVYDAHFRTYDVYYKDFLIWKYEQTYRVSVSLDDFTAKRMAIERAKNMLETVEIWRS